MLMQAKACAQTYIRTSKTSFYLFFRISVSFSGSDSSATGFTADKSTLVSRLALESSSMGGGTKPTFSCESAIFSTLRKARTRNSPLFPSQRCSFELCTICGFSTTTEDTARDQKIPQFTLELKGNMELMKLLVCHV